MTETVEKIVKCTFIESENEEGIKYSYIMYNKLNEYCFMPNDYHVYPQRMAKETAFNLLDSCYLANGEVDLDNADLFDISEAYNCSKLSVLECCKAIKRDIQGLNI